MTDSLLGNMGTKIFHANSDRETNQLAVGARRQAPAVAAQLRVGLQPQPRGPARASGPPSNRGRSEHMDYEIQPMEFSTLRKGGAENGTRSDALVFQNGRLWAAYRPHMAEGRVPSALRRDRGPRRPAARLGARPATWTGRARSICPPYQKPRSQLCACRPPLELRPTSRAGRSRAQFASAWRRVAHARDDGADRAVRERELDRGLREACSRSPRSAAATLPARATARASLSPSK